MSDAGSRDPVSAGFAALEREAAELAAQIGPGQESSATSVGTDESRTVQATVDGRGGVCDIDLDPRWRDQIPPEDLGPAVVTAIADAGEQLLASWADDLDQGTPRLPTRVKATQPARGLPADAAGPASESAQSAMRELLSILDAVDASLDEFERLSDEQAEGPVSASGPLGHVTATMTGGQIVAISIKLKWLNSADRPTIEQEVLDACEAVQGLAAHVVLDTGAPVKALREVLADPEAWLRRLGLPPSG